MDRLRGKTRLACHAVVVLILVLHSFWNADLRGVATSWDSVSFVPTNHSLIAEVFSQDNRMERGKNTTAKVLLGIINSFPAVSKYERRQRHLVRNTYLRYYEVPRRSQRNYICSLSEYIQQRDVAQLSNDHTDDADTNIQVHTNCRLVYAFVVAVNARNRYRLGQLQNQESDVVMVEQNHSQEDITLSWFRYATSSQWVGDFDYVAAIYSHDVVFPSTLLSETSEWLQSQSSVLIQSGTYTIANVPMTREMFSNTSSPATTITSIQDIERQRHDSSISTSHGVLSMEGSVYDFLRVYDKYERAHTFYDNSQEFAIVNSLPVKNKIISYQQTQGEKVNQHPQQHFPRMLLGIFSTDSEVEQERRDTIRDTWLTCYKHDPLQSNRICSLQDLLYNRLSQTECQLAYVFVLGRGGDSRLGNGSNSSQSQTLRVDYWNETSPIATIPSHPVNNNETNNDIVYLNIQENMINGKSETWFAYALSVLNADYYFDYVAKTDTDAVLFPNVLLEEHLNHLPPYPHNTRIYGGDYVQPDIRFPYAAFMHGKFYLVTPDLIRWIVSPELNHSAYYYPSECITISNYVHAHPLPIQRWEFANIHKVLAHPVKNVTQYRRVYEGRSKQT